MPSPFYLGKGSLKNSRGLHPDLYAILRLAITLTPIDFSVTCGPRTKAQQAKNVAKGVSKTMNSRHMMTHSPGFGLCCKALDFVPYIDGKPEFENVEAMKIILEEGFFHAAETLGIEGLESGGWMWGWDWYHVQLSRKKYR